MHFHKTSPKTRNQQQQKIYRNSTKTVLWPANFLIITTAQLRRKTAHWQHCLAVSKTQCFGSAGFFFSFLFVQLLLDLNNLQLCLSRQAKVVRPCQEIYLLHEKTIQINAGPRSPQPPVAPAASRLQYGRRRNANALPERGHIERIEPILAIISVEILLMFQAKWVIYMPKITFCLFKICALI